MTDTITDKHARQARAYHLRAEEVRTIGESARDARCREALIQIADALDRQASALESIAQPPLAGSKKTSLDRP